MELLATLGIAVVLVTVVAPRLQHLLQEQRATTRANLVVAYLNKTRFLAIDQQTRAHFCPTADGVECLDNDGGNSWNRGLLLYAGDSAEDAEVRFVESALPDFTIHSGGRPRFTFQADGSARGFNGTLVICDPTEISEGRAIVLAKAGRVRASRTRPDGSAPCPP